MTTTQMMVEDIPLRDRRSKMKNITNFTILGIIAGVSLISTVGVQSASAHQLAVLFGDNDTNDIFFVLGHTNEPAFGVESGVHDGKHGMEIRISDDATDLSIPQGNTELFFDKYYFKDVKKYNKANSVESATQMEKGIPVSQAFGEPGHYIHRQIVQDGIYGYHVYGTIDYYGTGERDVDITFFCLAEGMDDPTKFESIVGGVTFGEFGCPESTDAIKFPTKNGHHSSSFDKEDKNDDQEKDD